MEKSNVTNLTKKVIVERNNASHCDLAESGQEQKKKRTFAM